MQAAQLYAVALYNVRICVWRHECQDWRNVEKRGGGTCYLLHLIENYITFAV